MAARLTLVAGRRQMAATFLLSADILRLSRLVARARGVCVRFASRRPPRLKFLLEKGSRHRRQEVEPTGESAASS